MNVISWFLGLGERYDVVVNLDGFNEVALSMGENYSAGVYPYFPRRWDQRVAGVPDNDRLREIGRITYFQDLQKSLSPKVFPQLHSLAITRLVARLLQAIAGTQVSLGRAELRALPIRSDYESKGPFLEYKSQDVLRRAVVNHWARTSRLLDNLVRGEGGEYHHVLQPNQYFEGSKTLTEAELSTAYIDPDGTLGGFARDGYPLLRNRGAVLSASGLFFHDATQIYREIGETIYVDACCHVNQKGDDILAQFVVDEILATTSVPGLRPNSGVQ